jgi:ribosomal protein S12 methylthiotransferase accessory factor
MNKASIRPIMLGSPIVGEDKTIFYLARDIVHVQAPGALMRDILEVCNGQKTLEKAVELLGSKWDRNRLEEFLQHLLNVGVLYDSSAISSFVWPFVSNPTYFAKVVTDVEVSEMVEQACLRHRSHIPEKYFEVKEFAFQKLISRRRSWRSFSGKEIGMDKIVQMLWSAYGVITNLQYEDGFDRHTVPSAGALYPLQLFLVLLMPSGNISSGLYSIAFTKEGAVGLSKTSDDLTPLYQSFVDPLILRDASGVIVVSGSFAITEEKYGNRAMLYVPLEAGHVVQNIHLAATELDVATVEIGGFLEEPMQEALSLPKDYTPFVTVVFGSPVQEGKGNIAKQLPFEVQWMPPKAGRYKLPFNLAFARLAGSKQKSEDWACGRSTDPFVAYAKATAEAQEWMSCSLPRGLIRADISSLDSSVVSPEEIIAFHPEQYTSEDFPFHSFDLKREYEWKEAIDVMSGKRQYILADCIYFPYYPEYPLYASANSSGAAAYPTRKGAIERGVLELVERDAFMVVWLNHLEMPTVRFGSLPSEIQNRIRKLEEVGFSVNVNDLTLDLTPVLLVFAQSEELHYTTCSACSSFDTYEALEHALMEVESAVYCRLAFGSSEPIFPENVRMTQDHGKLYGQEAFFRRADFLKESRLLKDFVDVARSACFHWEILLARFVEHGMRILAVDLDGLKLNGIQSGLHIVKTFVVGLVPMSFGYQEEPCGMRRIYETPVALGFRSRPNRYDELNRFPHPYT